VEHKLFLCLEKCEFHQKQIEYLRLVISENKVAMDPVKVAGVCDWPTLENWTDMQAFIGFINFYYRFKQDFLTIARPVMNIEWDYSYYQPWSDNEWLVDEMLAMLDKDVTMQ